MRLLREVAVGGAAAATLVVGTLLWLEYAPRSVPEGQPPLATLSADSLPAFRSAFNAGHGSARVLVLLSPT